METDRSPDVTAADITWNLPGVPEDRKRQLYALADLPQPWGADGWREAFTVCLSMLHEALAEKAALERQVRYWKGRAK